MCLHYRIVIYWNLIDHNFFGDKQFMLFIILQIVITGGDKTELQIHGVKAGIATLHFNYFNATNGTILRSVSIGLLTLGLK